MRLCLESAHRLLGPHLERHKGGRGFGTFVVKPLVHGVGHVEGEPLALGSRFHNLAVNVALGWRR